MKKKKGTHHPKIHTLQGHIPSFNVHILQWCTPSKDTTLQGYIPFDGPTQAYRNALYKQPMCVEFRYIVTPSLLIILLHCSITYWDFKASTSVFPTDPTQHECLRTAAPHAFCSPTHHQSLRRSYCLRIFQPYAH